MNSGLEQPAFGNSTTRAALEALFRHLSAFLATSGLILLITVFYVLLVPRSYQSEMDILVRNARPDYLISPQANTGQVIPQDVTEERINSEIEVLRSKDVADSVVDPGWAAKPLAQHTEMEIKAHEKSVLSFSRHLEVELLRKSNVIHVTYTSGSPRDATGTVERLLAAFLDKQREIERSTGASSFFATEAARYKAELDRAQDQLAGYQQSNGIVSLPVRETTLEAQVTTLDDAIRTTEVEVSEAGQRVASDRSQLAQLPARESTQQRSIPNTQAVEQLVATLNTLENLRTQRMIRYQPTDPLIQEVDQQIATTSQALAQARATNGQEATTDVNPVYQQLKAVLATGTTDLAALRARLASETEQRDQVARQLAGVEGSTVNFTTLQARVTELQGNYQLYTQKRNEAEIADSMDQHQLVNVAVAENPTFSARPYRPQVLLDLALGVFTALFLGGCVVFFAELGRETVATPYELESLSDAPVLATLPMTVESLPRLRRSPEGRTPRPRPGYVPRPDADPPSGFAPSAPSAGPQPGYASGGAARSVASASPALPPRESTAIRRAAVVSFEQIAAAEAMPARPPRPASPFSDRPAAPLPDARRAEPREPEAHPVPPHRDETPIQNGRAERMEEQIHTRARLTPSQRVQLRRPVTTRDRNGRVAYVTYTLGSKLD